MTFWTDLLGAETRFHNAGGRRTRAIQAGDSGPVVIMMHGITGHAEGFCRNVLPISEACFQAYSIDALGHGLSEKPTDITYNTPTYVEHLKDFMDSIGAEKAFLLGQSLGAWTGFRFAHKYPERVLGLASITGAGLHLSDADSQETSMKVARGVQKVTQKAAGAPTADSVRTRLQWLMAHDESVTEELLATRLAYMTAPDAIFPKINKETVGPDNDKWMLTEEVLQEIKAQTLFLWSDKNPSMPARVAERAANLMGADFHMVEDAGHWPQFEQPEATNRILIEWLKSF